MTVAHKETMGFQTEARQLLHLMIHSLYSKKEIFLRELISNASDAADKLRFEALSNPALLADDPNLEIRIAIDKEARTLAITDNGIGMSREEAISHLGTIARSGTARVRAAALGRPAQGLAADRAVRCGLLQRLHGRGPRRGVQPPRRPRGVSGRALGIGRGERVHRRGRRARARAAPPWCCT